MTALLNNLMLGMILYQTGEKSIMKDIISAGKIRI